MNSDFSQPSTYSVDQARDAILEAAPVCTQTDDVTPLNALGRVLASDLFATHEIPSFRNSAMDGYAIRFGDYQPDTPFEVVDKSLAGHPYTGAMPPGSAVKITTGARIPDDADTIIIQENTIVDGHQIHVTRAPEPHEFVRHPGDDITKGKLLIPAGTSLNAAHAGLISAQGLERIEVYRQPVIAVFSTGDELMQPGTRLEPGAIYDSNRTTLRALLKQAGFDSKDLGIVKDNEAEISQLLQQLHDVDFVISSGGVSVGEADHMKAALEATGRLHFWKVAMKPGKPLVTGTLADGAFYFGLPGNPVSSMVTCIQFVIPALYGYSKQPYIRPPVFRAISQSDLSKAPGRFEFQRGRYSIDANGAVCVSTTGMQDSHVLSSMAAANCFICLDEASNGAQKGEYVDVILFDTLPGITR